MLKLKTEWSKSFPVLPCDHLKLHVLEKKYFKPSYEYEKCPETISTLLSWEHSRIWLEEREKWLESRRAKPKRFKNDYKSWLEKHKRRVDDSGVKK